MNGGVKSFNKRTIQTINNLNVMLRKLTVKVDADISSLLFLSSFYQSAALGRPSGFLLSRRAAVTGARCVARPHVAQVLTLSLMRDFRKCRGHVVERGLQKHFLVLKAPTEFFIFRPDSVCIVRLSCTFSLMPSLITDVIEYVLQLNLGSGDGLRKFG